MIKNKAVNKIFARSIAIETIFATQNETNHFKCTIHGCARHHFRPAKRNSLANYQTFNANILRRMASLKISTKY